MSLVLLESNKTETTAEINNPSIRVAFPPFIAAAPFKLSELHASQMFNNYYFGENGHLV